MADSMWVLPFGDFNGEDIEDVPDTYLTWLKGEKWFREKFADKVSIVDKELKYCRGKKYQSTSPSKRTYKYQSSFKKAEGGMWQKTLILL